MHSWQTVDAHLNLEADFALRDSVRASDSGPHESKASKGHRRRLEAVFVNGQAHIAVICNVQSPLLTAQCHRTHSQSTQLTKSTAEATAWMADYSQGTQLTKIGTLASIDMDAFGPSPPLWPAATLTFDLQNLIRSSVGASKYSL